MRELQKKRVIEFQRRIADEGIDLAVIHDPDSIYFLSGFWGYLGMDFGRPTILVIPRSATPTLITPGLAMVSTGADGRFSLVAPGPGMFALAVFAREREQVRPFLEQLTKAAGR